MHMWLEVGTGLFGVIAVIVWWFTAPVRCGGCGHLVTAHMLGRTPTCDVGDCSCPGLL